MMRFIRSFVRGKTGENSIQGNMCTMTLLHTSKVPNYVRAHLTEIQVTKIYVEYEIIKNS